MHSLHSRTHVLVRRWREGRVLDAVAVYLADVEVLLHFGHFGGGDAVGGAPDAGWGGGMLVFVLVSRVQVGGLGKVVSGGGVLGLSKSPRAHGR